MAAPPKEHTTILNIESGGAYRNFFLLILEIYFLSLAEENILSKELIKLRNSLNASGFSAAHLTNMLLSSNQSKISLSVIHVKALLAISERIIVDGLTSSDSDEFKSIIEERLKLSQFTQFINGDWDINFIKVSQKLFDEIKVYVANNQQLQKFFDFERKL